VWLCGTWTDWHLVVSLPAAESGCVSYVDLKKMPWLFKGKGDIQFDVYRDIKNATK